MTKDSNQIVTMSLYTFEDHRYWAFKQMRLGLSHFSKCEGLQFYKILGTGAGNGFSLWPNLRQYAMMCVWENESQAKAYFANHPYQTQYRMKAATVNTYWMRPIFGHGQWDGRAPFQYQPDANQHAGMTAVITRATIRMSRMLEFWRYVPSVSREMEKQDGLKLAVGIGEWPVVQQATFSVWDSWSQMKAFAYQSEKHRKVIEKTRTRNWYKEELFARFCVYEMS